MIRLEPIMLAQSAESFFSSFDPDQRFVLTIIGLGCSTLLFLILGGVFLGLWSSGKEKQIEADLKRDMLDRGMSAEEIEKVIGAKPKTGWDRCIESWSRPARS